MRLNLEVGPWAVQVVQWQGFGVSRCTPPCKGCKFIIVRLGWLVIGRGY